MSTEENKAVARRFYEIVASGDARGAGEIVAEDYVNHNAIAGQNPGLEGYKNTVADLAAAFADLRFTIEDQVAEGDKVASRYTASGTHIGEFMGASPTNQSVSWSALVIQRVLDGKIQESWLYMDQLGLRKQLGLAT